MRLLGTIAAMSFLIAGCATPGQNMSAADTAELNAPLYCNNETECKNVWERATYYVSTNSGYKIQNINDNLIETYNSVSPDTKLAWRVLKKPLGDGKYQIVTSAWCGNAFGCTPDPYEAILDAKRYMKEGL